VISNPIEATQLESSRKKTPIQAFTPFKDAAATQHDAGVFAAHNGD
jgi:hypothetical protein